MKFNFEEGEILLVDKPLEWTSFDIVKKVRGMFRIKKVGHAGTLDPLATGLMLLGTGKKTKELHSLQGLDKEYTGIISIGHSTPSYDLETEFDQTFKTEHITEDTIRETAAAFIGNQEQVPPSYSAIKIKGERAYFSARKGKPVEIEPRKITIHEFEITDIQDLNVHFRIKCSKGTYIRTIAHDFGKALNSGAHLSALRRTMIGSYKIDDSYTIEQLNQIKESLRSGSHS